MEIDFTQVCMMMLAALLTALQLEASTNSIIINSLHLW